MKETEAIQSAFEDDDQNNAEKTPAAIALKDIVMFIRYIDINVISDIFKEDDYVLAKVQQYREEFNKKGYGWHDTELSWLNLILDLDNHRLNILAQFIKEYHPIYN